MQLTAEEARAIVDEDHGDWKQIEETIVETSRWSILYEAIHRHLKNGKHYRFFFDRAATEQQEKEPYECDDTVEVREVVQVEKKILVWEDRDATA